MVLIGPASLTAWPVRPRSRQKGSGYTAAHLVRAPPAIRCCSWSRWPPSEGEKAIRAASGGGTATIARWALAVSPSASTTTPAPSWAIPRTGVSSTTASPSAAASLIEISCEPPRKRSCWAPPSVSIRASKLPAELT